MAIILYMMLWPDVWITSGNSNNKLCIEQREVGEGLALYDGVLEGHSSANIYTGTFTFAGQTRSIQIYLNNHQNF